MAVVDSLVIEISASSDKATRSLDELTKSLERVKGTLESLTVKSPLGRLRSELEGVTKQTTKWQSALSDLARGTSFTPMTRGISSTVARLGIMGLGLRAVTNSAKSWVQESSDYVENLNLFTVTMGDAADEALRYAETVRDAVGIDPSEWIRNQGMFKQIASGFGVVEDKANLMSKNLTQLGYDISSFYNIGTDEAMQKLQSAIVGEVRPLRELGYTTDVATLQQVALAHGITQSVNSMSQAQKAQLRYIAIMEQSGHVMGDLARTTQSPGNSIRILQQEFTQLARAAGNLLIPALQKIIPVVRAVVEVLTEGIQALANLFGFELPKIDYSGLGNVAAGADEAADALGGATKAAKEMKRQLIGLDELSILQAPDAGGGGGGVGGASGGDLGLDLPGYDDFLGDLTTKTDKLKATIKELIGPVLAVGAGIAAWKVSDSLLRFIADLGSGKLSALSKISLGIGLAVSGFGIEFGGLESAVKEGLAGLNFAEILLGGITGSGGLALLSSGLASWIASAFSGGAVATALKTAAANLGLETAGAAGAALGAAVGGIIAGVPAYFVGIYDALKNGLDWLNGLLIPAGSAAAGAGIGAIIGSLGGPIGAGIGALIGLAVGLVTDGIIAVTEHWGAITDFLSGFFTETIPGLWNDFTGWLGTIPETLGEFFGSLPEKISAWFDSIWEPVRQFDWAGFGYDMGQALGGAVKSAVDFVTVTVPGWLAETYETVKASLDTFFTSTLPNFFTVTVPAAFKTVVDFVASVPEKLWNAIQAGWNWFIEIGHSIVNGIFEGLQTVWQSIKDFVGGFVQGFKDALGIHSPSTVFAEIGGYLIQGLVNGLYNNFSGIGSFFSSFVNSAWSWGSDLAANLANGIASGINWVIDAVSNVASWINAYLHFSEPDIGPLADFSSYMPDMLKTMSLGIRDNAHLAISAVSDLSGAMAEEMTFEPSDFSFDPVDYTEETSFQGAEPTNYSFDNQAYNRSRKDTEELISVIFAVGQQIIRAINDKDVDVNIDGRSIAQKITNIQDNHSRMLGKSPKYV